MLVHLSFKFGRQGGQDDEITQDICQRNGASADSLKASKRTICKEAFEPLANIRTLFTAAVKRCTIPWDIKGVYFCKPANVHKIIAARDEYGREFNRLKDEHLLAQYDTWFAMTEEKLGKAFKEDEFPSREELIHNVKFHLSIMPLPESEALRKIKDIDESLLSELIKSNDQRIQQGIRQGMITAYNRLMEPLQKMVDVLSGDKPRIYETLVTNVKDVVAEIPGLNLTDDPQLARFAESARQMLGNLTADQLRDSRVVRRETAEKARELITQFGQLGVRKFLDTTEPATPAADQAAA